jgi:hypothetical protein
MPLIEISGADAVSTRKTNPHAVWGNRSHANRVEPVTKPGFAVPFQMSPGEKIFTVGSCFARHVENALIKRGFDLPMRQLFKKDEFRNVDTSVVNNFGTPSIYNEFSWAMGVEEFNPHDHIVEVQNGKFVDMHLIPSVRPAEWDIVLKRREAVTAAYRSFVECKVIIITLGLVEIWYDTETGYYLNSAPRPFMLRNQPDRFKLHVLSFEETYGYLKKTVDLISEYGRSDLQIILTVSPVPLAVTHRPEDVIVANSYSKSVLRTVADTITAQYEFVTYYPSYESVTLSDRLVAWKDDFQHVTDEIVALNINRMVDAFVPSGSSVANLREAIEAGGVIAAVEKAETMRKGSPLEAAEFFEEFGKFSIESAEFAAEHAQFLMDEKDYTNVVELLERTGYHDQGGLNLLKARALLKLGKAPEAYEIVNVIANSGNKSASIWTLFLDAAKEIGDPDVVIEVLNKWTKLVPQRAGRAHALVGRWFHERGEYDRAVKFFEIGTSLNMEDALIGIYHVETLISLSQLDDAREVFAKIRPQLRNEDILYERLKEKLANEALA